jgi:hypothetical protein
MAINLWIFADGDPSVGIAPASWAVEDIIPENIECDREGIRAAFVAAFSLITGDGERVRAVFDDEFVDD